MVTFRHMTEDDVPAAVAAFESGLLGITAGLGMPVTGNSIQDERRRQDRTRHFLGTDPGGSWVAEEGDTIVGMSQSFVREEYWMLSQLGTVPGRQGRGVGRDLLKLALSYGDPDSPGTIQCSQDPKAMALLDAVRTLVDELGPRVVIVAGADLAHVGPRFGDPLALGPELREELEKTDAASLDLSAQGDAAGFWKQVTSDLETRRVCGLSPIYAMLRTLPTASRGSVLHYEQTIDGDDGSIVSHAAVAFHA